MKHLKLFENIEDSIPYKDGKVKDPEKRGYIAYRRYDDGVWVMMGSYTNPENRGEGVFKTLFAKLMDKIQPGETIQAAATSKILASYLQRRYNFHKIKHPVRHWGRIANGVSLELTKEN